MTRRTAERVNGLLGISIAVPAQVDVTDLKAVGARDRRRLSAVLYVYNLGVS